MATLGELRDALKDWLEAQIRIDRWTANPPTNVATEIDGALYPANVGMQSPIRGFRVSQDYEDTAMGAVTIPFAVTYRFDKSLAYHQLPIDQAEILASSVMLEAVFNSGCIHPDIRSIEAEPYDPVEVARFEQPNTPDTKDWLLILYFPFKVNGIFEPGLSNLNPGGGGVEPPYNLVELDVGIWRSKIEQVADPDNSVLDRELTLLDPTP